MHKFSWVNFGATAIALLFSHTSLADKSIRADVSVGLAHVAKAGYDEGAVLDQSLAIENIALYRVGYIYVKNIHLENSRYDDSQVEIEVKGPYAGLGKSFDLGRLKLEAGGGIMVVTTEGKYASRTYTSDRKTRPYANAKLLLPLSKLISLQADVKYLNDVSGSDLYLYTGGVRFSF